MPETYRFINTQTQDAALNMAIDEAILQHHLQGQVPPTLRVFRWSRSAITLGRFQNVEREIDLELCQQRSIDLVRRPTGGRAVYHRDEFTYSFVSSRAYGVPAGIVAAYAYLAQGLIAALARLGIQAELSEGRVSKQPSAACFASSTQADLTSGGFKLIGSAQVWKDDALLQQGSLPLDDRAEEFYALLRFVDEGARAEALGQYREATTPLHTLAPGTTWESVAEALHAGMSEILRTPFQVEDLSVSEWEMARRLAADKYSRLVWQNERVRLVEPASEPSVTVDSARSLHLP